MTSDHIMRVRILLESFYNIFIFRELLKTHKEVNWYANASEDFLFRKRYDKIVEDYNGIRTLEDDQYHYKVVNNGYNS